SKRRKNGACGCERQVFDRSRQVSLQSVQYAGSAKSRAAGGGGAARAGIQQTTTPNAARAAAASHHGPWLNAANATRLIGSRTMFGKKRRNAEAQRSHREQRREAYRQRQAEGAELHKRLYELRKMDRASLPEAATLLFKDAQHQVALIRQSVADRTDYDFVVGDGPSEGDMATSLAEYIADLM